MTLQAINQGRQTVFVYGASGHAKVLIDTIEKQGQFQVLGLLDDNLALKGVDVYGYKVIGGKEEISSQDCSLCLVAIGDNRIRHEVACWLQSAGICLPDAIVHPSASLARGVSVGAGSVIVAGCVVNSDTTIGSNTIINTGATIDHDCRIGDSVHVSPGVTVCGGVSVGDLTLIGAGAIIHPNVKIGKNAVVGAGATVLNNVADGALVVGTPAEAVD